MPAPVWWAVALVAAVHLLTTTGAWIITDQAEALFTARRLLSDGTLDLAPASAPRVSALPWLRAEPGHALRTRLLPGTAVTLAPLLALDRALGWEDPEQYGRLVHLHGHLFVLAGLALLGLAVWRRGRSAQAAAATVVLAGLSWPVWQVSKRGGSAPVLFFLAALFVSAGAAAAGRRRPPAADLVRAAACALLPWVNPAGSVISAVFAGATWLEGFYARRLGSERGERPRVWPLAAGCAVGNATVIVLWNQLYHGHAWLGGYGAAHLGHESWFGVAPLFTGFLARAWEFLRLGPWLVLPALWFAWREGAPGRPHLILPVLLSAALFALFATFYDPEPARRFSVLCPAWAVALGWGWARTRWRYPWNLLALVGALVLGVSWFLLEEGRYYAGPGGLFYPSVLWVKRAIDGAPLWQTALPVGALLLLAAVAADRVASTMRPS